MTHADQAYPDMIPLEPGAAGYPAPVAAACGARAPVLTCRGNADLLDRAGIGFCGSRKASDKGLETARDCADQVARAGCVVISAPPATMFAWAPIPEPFRQLGSVEFSKLLLEKARVAVAPVSVSANMATTMCGSR